MGPCAAKKSDETLPLRPLNCPQPQLPQGLQKNPSEKDKGHTLPRDHAGTSMRQGPHKTVSDFGPVCPPPFLAPRPTARAPPQQSSWRRKGWLSACITAGWLAENTKPGDSWGPGSEQWCQTGQVCLHKAHFLGCRSDPLAGALYDIRDGHRKGRTEARAAWPTQRSGRPARVCA